MYLPTSSSIEKWSLLFHPVLMDYLKENHFSFSSAILLIRPSIWNTPELVFSLLCIHQHHSDYVCGFVFFFFPLKKLVVILPSHSISTISSSWSGCINLQNDISKARLTEGKQKTNQKLSFHTREVIWIDVSMIRSSLTYEQEKTT